MRYEIAKLDPHQQAVVDRFESEVLTGMLPGLFDMSDAGTGKTITWLECARRFIETTGRNVLVLTTKTLITAAWRNDAKKLALGDYIVDCSAGNRPLCWQSRKAPGIYVANHDAVKSMVNVGRGIVGSHVRDEFRRLFEAGMLIVDESTAFKNVGGTARSTAALALSGIFQCRNVLTGFPNPTGVKDLWAQTFIIDQGERLSKSFQGFKQATHDQLGNELPGALETVLEIIGDLVIRNRLDDCHSIPDQTIEAIEVPLSRKVKRDYDSFSKEMWIEALSDDPSRRLNRSVLFKKLMQLSAGVLIGLDREVKIIHKDRINAIAEHVAALPNCIVAFELTAFGDALKSELEKRGISVAVIDGRMASAAKRAKTIEAFQRGDIRCLLCHPKTVAHGATLTKTQYAIWSAPTSNADYWYQFNRRIRRRGQNKKTVVYVYHANTREEVRYAKLLKSKMEKFDFLDEFFKEGP